VSDLTLVRVYEELQGLGYRGGYDAVRRYATAWQRERSAVTAAAYVPLSFAPGEAYQFDWSHEIVVIAGATTTVKVAHIRASRAPKMTTASSANSFTGLSERRSTVRPSSRSLLQTSWATRGLARRRSDHAAAG
jgi:hypothetical protein